MLRSILTIIAVMLLVSAADSQFKQGDVELSFFGNMGSFESKSTTSGLYGDTYSDSRKYITISFASGYFIIDGLSLEPEVKWIAVEKTSPAFYLLGNISYTHLLPESKVGLFARVGYGVSNSILAPIFGGIIIRNSDKLDICTFNAGAGTKYLVHEHVALRVEINYKSQSWSREETYWGTTTKYETSNTDIGLLLGFSILL